MIPHLNSPPHPLPGSEGAAVVGNLNSLSRMDFAGIPKISMVVEDIPPTRRYEDTIGALAATARIWVISEQKPTEAGMEDIYTLRVCKVLAS